MNPLDQLEHAVRDARAFKRTWDKIVEACEEGLSDQDYPPDRRPALYELLGAARECAQPDALQQLRLAHQPA